LNLHDQHDRRFSALNNKDIRPALIELARATPTRRRDWAKTGIVTGDALTAGDIYQIGEENFSPLRTSISIVTRAAPSTAVRHLLEACRFAISAWRTP
jgi:hypothetical protein